MDPIKHITFTNELRFERKRPEVFEAFVFGTEKWFQISYGGDRLKRVIVEPKVGGLICEDWGDGAGKLYGSIGWWDPPAGYSEVSTFLGGGITMHQRYEFIEDGDATLLRQGFSAFGPISDEMAAAIESHGSLRTFDAQLHAWIERGEQIPPPQL